MPAKSRITKKLEEAYEPGIVNAGQVYKGTDYDGVRQATGWWFCKFGSTPMFLGSSVAAAIEEIDNIIAGREEAAR